ncbi:MAG: amidohydrolase [Armatimonadia bacterium]|nr:amidohydrolase [Armatimonadia bacterium]
MAQLDGLLPAAQSMQEWLTETRRHFHRHPELSCQEHATAEAIAGRLRDMGVAVTEGIAETGVVGLLAGRDGPCVAIRADTDALPITEATEAPYSSQVPGVMHACGHDAHITCALGAARLLADRAAELPGAVKLIFQPSEEMVSGAARMIDEGVLENPAVDRCIGFHVSALYPVPVVSFSHGPKMAGTNSFTIEVRGESGHAGYPHLTVDPIPIAAQIVLALQTVVSRRVQPTEPAVISIGQIQGGTKCNIIGDRVVMEGTMRFFEPDLREAMVAWTKRIVEGVAESMGGSAQLRVGTGTPPLICDDDLTDVARAACARAIGEEAVALHDERFMGGEDFAYFAERVPSTHFWLGIRKPGAADWPSLHSDRFDIDETALPVGAASLAACALGLLEGAGE